MAKINGDSDVKSNSTGLKFASANIAGDDSSGKGLTIEPTEPFISRDEIRSTGNGGIQFDDQVPAADHRRANEKAKLDSLKSATGPSSFGQEANRQLIEGEPEWPGDE